MSRGAQLVAAGRVNNIFGPGWEARGQIKDAKEIEEKETNGNREEMRKRSEERKDQRRKEEMPGMMANIGIAE
jgi:hypothetical protein